ncbi:hypothetical protein SEA_SCHMIDT_41 [Gordonia phage Schmidt]|uniref:Uncharacterized protein n=1 Tax=Gordonia phage Schmidt TaxID=2301697 RepID=A0A385E068_9CAUD|nr:hypothetical protein KDJ59_gp41 [Gordonia phage Schmidt]AXQ65163.1 hypothetical protein SEA_SCHMIDT_41 [Gordonia phage Schmidt]
MQHWATNPEYLEAVRIVNADHETSERKMAARTTIARVQADYYEGVQ